MGLPTKKYIVLKGKEFNNIYWTTTKGHVYDPNKTELLFESNNIDEVRRKYLELMGLPQDYQ